MASPPSMGKLRIRLERSSRNRRFSTETSTRGARVQVDAIPVDPVLAALAEQVQPQPHRDVAKLRLDARDLALGGAAPAAVGDDARHARAPVALIRLERAPVVARVVTQL